MNADADRPGSGPARLALEYLAGRLDGTLDLSGRLAQEGESPRASPADPARSGGPVQEGEPPARPEWRRVALIDAPDERWEGWLSQQGVTRIRRWDQELRQPDGAGAISARDTAGAGPRGLVSRGLTEALAGADLVLLRVPKDRALFRAYLDAARQLAPGALIVAAGAVKHMDPSFTGDMRDRFPRVDVSPAAHKARLLIASGSSAEDWAGSRVGRAPAPSLSSNLSSPDPVSLPDPATPPAQSPPSTAAGPPLPASLPAPVAPVTAQKAPAAAQPAGWEHPVDIRIDAGSGLTVHALHGTFHGASVDAGSRLLTEALAQAARRNGPGPRSIVELGCGNGWLSAWLARNLSPDHLWACDVSRLAVDSTARTLAANGFAVSDAAAPGADAGGAADIEPGERADADSGGLRTQVVLDDVLGFLPAAVHAGWPSPDLLVCNPPFHAGAAVDTSVAQRMIRAAGEVLAPGGVAVFVYNSHLRYRPLLERWIGPVEQLARDRRFTVVAASGRYRARNAPEVG